MQIFCGLVILGLMISGFIGWVLNIVKLFGIHDVGAEFALRILGIFLPFVGAIGGYF